MIEVLTLSDIAAPLIVLNHLPIEVAHTPLRFRDEVLARFPGEISHFILFGSQARGETIADSDVDVMIVASWHGESLRRGDREIGVIAYGLLLEGYAGHLSPFVIEEDWFEADHDVVIEARREGFDLLTRN